MWKRLLQQRKQPGLVGTGPPSCDLCHVTYTTVLPLQQKPYVVVLLKKKGLQVTGDMRHVPQFVRYDRMLFFALFIQNPIRPPLHVTYAM